MLRLLLLCSLLFACHPSPQPVQFASGDGTTPVFEVPVTFDTVAPPAGWDGKEVVFLEVPASSSPTKIAVRNKPKTIGQMLLPDRKEQDFQIVSDNKDVKATEAPSTPWWWWATGIFVLVSMVVSLLSYLRVYVPGFGWLFRLIARRP